MTDSADTPLQMLERLAEKVTPYSSIASWQDFRGACSPETILALVRVARAALRIQVAGDEIVNHGDMTTHLEFNEADKEMREALKPFHGVK